MKKISFGLALLLAVVACMFIYRASREKDVGSVHRQQQSADNVGPQLDREPEGDDERNDLSPHAAVARRGAFLADLNYRIPAGNALEVYADLKSQAEAGDHRSAVLLFEKLEACRNSEGLDFPLTPAEKAKRLNETADGCAQLTDEQYQSAARLVEAAAAAGMVEAQLIYSANPRDMFSGPLNEALRNTDRIVEYKRNVFRYLTESASRGSVDAMAELAAHYRRGGLGKQDAVKAYAYRYAAEKAYPTATSVMQRYTEGLSSEQIQQGRMQGEEIYRACCQK